MKKIWAVYTQYYPTYKNEESIESLWSNKKEALKHAKEVPLYIADYVWIAPLNLDYKYLHSEEEECEGVMVRKP